MALFGPKSVFFGQKSIFCPHPPISSLPSWPDTKKTTFLCRSCCSASSWGAARAYFWPKNSPKIRFFYATPIKSLFFGLRRTWLNEIITSTYPEVTLDTFCFSVGAHSAARQAVVWPQLLKITISGAKNAYYAIASHDIVLYCTELNCIIWYCTVLQVIALFSYGIARYCMVLHGIVLYLGIALLAPAGCFSQNTYLLYQFERFHWQPGWLYSTGL